MLPSVMALKWQKTSSPPLSGVMNPKPKRKKQRRQHIWKMD
jgi:hypothetical protein